MSPRVHRARRGELGGCPRKFMVKVVGPGWQVSWVGAVNSQSRARVQEAVHGPRSQRACKCLAVHVRVHSPDTPRP